MSAIERNPPSPEWRRSELVVRLLLGEVDLASAQTAGLGYQLEDMWHLGVIATGMKAADALRDLQTHTDCALLTVPRDQQIWAWLSWPHQLKATELEQALSSNLHADVSLACGELCAGLDGWELTHNQAQEAQRVADRKPQATTWYADVPLLALALGNDNLTRTLQQIYLEPLRSQKDGGAALRATLRAYLSEELSATPTALAIGVSRPTVERRVRTVEQLIGQTIPSCLSELYTALQLEELPDHQTP